MLILLLLLLSVKQNYKWSQQTFLKTEKFTLGGFMRAEDVNRKNKLYVLAFKTKNICANNYQINLLSNKTTK